MDFVCLPAWLIIEVDGEYHADQSQTEYDGGRTHDLQEMSFCVLRFTNQEVLQNLPDALRAISRHLALLLPSDSSQTSGSPSPQGARVYTQVYNQLIDKCFFSRMTYEIYNVFRRKKRLSEQLKQL